MQRQQGRELEDLRARAHQLDAEHLRRVRWRQIECVELRRRILLPQSGKSQDSRKTIPMHAHYQSRSLIPAPIAKPESITVSTRRYGRLRRALPSTTDASLLSLSDPLARSASWLLFTQVTRENDVGFYSTPASFARVTHHIQQAYLEKVLRAGQRILREALTKLLPELANKHWPEDEEMVRFGNGDLAEQGLAAGLHGLKCKDIDLVIAHECIFDLIGLRNDKSHAGKNFAPQQGRAIDERMMKVQRMANRFLNYRGAMEIRKMRDGLQDHIKEAYKDLLSLCSDLAPGTELPVHHERLLRNAVKEPRKYPKSIVRASRAWNRGGHPESEGFPSSGTVIVGDGYKRRPGQGRGYFSIVNDPEFDVDTPEYEQYLRYGGAPERIVQLSSKEKLEEYEANKSPVVFDLSLFEVDTSWPIKE